MMNSEDFQERLAFLRRHPFFTICGGLTILLAAVSWLLWQNMGELEAERHARAQEGEGMLFTLITGPQLRQELSAVREYTHRVEDNLVVETDLADNLGYFSKIEKRTRVRLDDLHQLNSPPPDTGSPYRRVPYTLRVTGTYLQVWSFLNAIETGPRLANISSFSLRRREAGSSTLTLDLSLDLLGKP